MFLMFITLKTFENQHVILKLLISTCGILMTLIDLSIQNRVLTGRFAFYTLNWSIMTYKRSKRWR